jgi:hypothetical protein
VKTSKKQEAARITDGLIPSDCLPALRAGREVVLPIPVEVPALIEDAGPAAQFAWEEFIYARVRNPYTRQAYGHAVKRFLRHCQGLELELAKISPRDVAGYLDGLPCAAATKNLHLSAIRHFFDTLAIRCQRALKTSHSGRIENRPF